MKQRTGKASTRVKPAAKKRAGRRSAGTPEQRREVRQPAPAALMTVRMVETPVPYAEISIHEPFTADSMERILESSRWELLRYQPRRVLVDMRDATVSLSISDMNGLVKVIAANYTAKVERFAIVLRPMDMPAEKFVEPSLSNRGIPTYTTQDFDEAVGWITTKLLRPR